VVLLEFKGEFGVEELGVLAELVELKVLVIFGV
jgi:hypothetical protein